MMEGEMFSHALKKEQVAPPVVIALLHAGEEAGELPTMLRYAAELLEEDISLAVETVTSLLEPMIMVVMGRLVGFVVLAAIMPTVQIIQSL